MSLHCGAREAYKAGMTELLQQAIDALRQLPQERQDYIARAILALSAEEIDPEHLPHVLQGLAETERGEFAADTEAVLRRFLAG
jgi:hypothetical protein